MSAEHMPQGGEQSAHAQPLVCETVCDGKAFWLRDVVSPRKCTQSVIQMCYRAGPPVATSSAAVGSDNSIGIAGTDTGVVAMDRDPAMVRKVFNQSEHGRAAYEQEKAMLMRCQGALMPDAPPEVPPKATRTTPPTATAAAPRQRVTPAIAVAVPSVCNDAARMMFPRVLAYDDDALTLSLSYCGVPVQPNTIPKRCRAQVREGRVSERVDDRCCRAPCAHPVIGRAHPQMCTVYVALCPRTHRWRRWARRWAWRGSSTVIWCRTMCSSAAAVPRAKASCVLSTLVVRAPSRTARAARYRSSTRRASLSSWRRACAAPQGCGST